MGSYGVIKEFEVEYLGVSSLRELRVLSSINKSIYERVNLEKSIYIFIDYVELRRF